MTQKTLEKKVDVVARNFAVSCKTNGDVGEKAESGRTFKSYHVLDQAGILYIGREDQRRFGFFLNIIQHFNIIILTAIFKDKSRHHVRIEEILLRNRLARYLSDPLFLLCHVIKPPEWSTALRFGE
jgi:hypothetical protein